MTDFPIEKEAIIAVPSDHLREVFGRHALEKVAQLEGRFSLSYSSRFEHPCNFDRAIFYGTIANEFVCNALDSIKLKGLSQHSYEGRMTIRLKGRRGRVRFEVEDDGSGIAPDLEGKLFQPIKSPKKITGPYAFQNRPFIGWYGFGLYGLRQIVKHINGSCGYQNKGENVGAVFWCELPVSLEDNEA